MGLLVEGKWHTDWYDTSKTKGRFVRKDSSFRNWVTPDGKPGPSGEAGFAAEPGRYHLYVSMACPWAHRTLIFRRLKGLEKMISICLGSALARGSVEETFISTSTISGAGSLFNTASKSS